MDDSHSRTFSDLINLFKSWIPWRSEPAHVSRDFWMPDRSCRVCYDCDSQFTLFNRRHHCRLCGRIFCSKCTTNWVPTEPEDPKTPVELWDKIRVCNYCFKQWKKGSGAPPPVDDGVQDASLDNVSSSSSSPSANSFLSTRSSATGASSGHTFTSLPQSIGFSPFQSPPMETSVERQSVGVATTNDHAVDIGEQNRSQNQFGFFQIRSDDDDEEYAMSHQDSAASDFSEVNSYYSHVEFGHTNSDYKSRKVHPDGDTADSKSINTSPLHASFDSQTSEEVQQMLRKSVEHDIGDECEPTSSLYVAEDVNLEPVDFENNGVLWLPPEPDDEEDEREALLFEDDDDGDAAGEWGYLRNSSSFGSGESRSRDKSNEEHKKAMKNVVDNHFRALVAQLLQVENLLTEEENDKESWLEIITALSWEAATILKPDTSKGGQMDPGGYVKVKCLASGLRSQSLVVKGVVCKKNVAHRRMATKVEKARLLILGGALEYQRVSNALSSFDTLLQQEMDHLKMAVAKIDAHNPDILLVEKSVSRYAQEYLLAKDISLVLNIKRSLLERIARCTGAQIVPSIDHLSSSKSGYCDMFRVERFSEEHGSAGQAGKKLVKTLMSFEGCPKPLGCTILLRGANGDELKKVKHVVQYGVFAAYHLALETSFLADEGASLPEFPLETPITVALPDKQLTSDRSISLVPAYTVPPSEKTPEPQIVAEPVRSNSVPPSDLIKATIASINEYSETNNLSASMISQYAEPLVSSSNSGCQHSFLDEPSTNLASEDQGLVGFTVASEAKPFEADRLAAIGDFSDFQCPKIKTMVSDCSDIGSGLNVSDPSSLPLDGNQTLEEQPMEEAFPPSPSDHQSILVSLSSRCVWKGTVCERSHLFRFKYYGNFDKPLGRFLRDHLFDQNYVCRSCAMPAEAHVQCYTHRQGTLTISVKKLPEILLPGEKDGKIWMWHRCLRCPRTNGFPPATRRIVMSDAAWGLSFGKFLELSFSNHAAASRVASCGHSLHRDCLRFYGFGKMVACFRYASIDVHSVCLPPAQLHFNYESQEWIEKEVTEVVERAELLFNEVLNAIHRLLERKSSLGQLSNAMNIAESRRRITDLKGMLQSEKSEFEESLQKILSKDTKEEEKVQPIIDILELNRLRRQLVFQSYIWDHRLIYAASLDVKNPDNVEITSPDPVQKPIADTDKIPDANTDKIPDNSESKSPDAETEQDPDHGEKSNILDNHLEFVKPDHGNQTDTKKETDESDPLLSGVTVRRALSDGQAPICLSATLDAAWTGEKSESAAPSISSTVGLLSEQSGGEDHREISKVSQTPHTTEETLSWLGMPFISFYRSLNKNFLGSAQKLDTLGEYDPVYISSFRESELQGGARLLLPVGVNDTVIPVFDDEPTSIIAYALVSHDYLVQLADDSSDRPKDVGPDSMLSMQSLDAAAFHSFHSLDETVLESNNKGSGEESTLTSRNSLPLDPLSSAKALHARVSFSDEGHFGKVKYTVTCYYAKQFEELRKICCPSEVDYVRSLSRCKKWGAQGGKSNVFFAKTLDDRFIIKQVTKTELESFNKFAPSYFMHLTEALAPGGGPTCLAKILGIYQVTSKHLKGGKETKMDLLIMENLLFGRNLTRLYDLKGSSRSRYNPDSSGSNKVLLDQNLIETMPTSPIFVSNKAKRRLERAVWNDTSFLQKVDVMDYSLLVGVDEEKHELVLGIIDFMRQYTWDKHLETWVKASGILGGSKNAPPTVISPRQYKKRFRKAMTTYFLIIPDQWSPPIIIPSKSQNELSEMINTQNVQDVSSNEYEMKEEQEQEQEQEQEEEEEK